MVFSLAWSCKDSLEISHSPYNGLLSVSKAPIEARLLFTTGHCLVAIDFRWEIHRRTWVKKGPSFREQPKSCN